MHILLTQGQALNLSKILKEITKAFQHFEGSHQRYQKLKGIPIEGRKTFFPTTTRKKFKMRQMYFVKDYGKSNTHNKYVPIYPFLNFRSGSSLYGPWRKVSFLSRSSLYGPWRKVSFHSTPSLNGPWRNVSFKKYSSMVLDEIHHLYSRPSINGPWRNVSFKK